MHLATGATFSEAFKEGAASIHDGHNCGRQTLAKGDRGSHGQCCHDIEADLSAPKVTNDFRQKGR
ncbi:hypothetical protein thsrh120_31550 [Rhizobium sp. No.120]